MLIHLAYLDAFFSAPGAAQCPRALVKRAYLTNISSTLHAVVTEGSGITYIKVHGQSLKMLRSIRSTIVVNSNLATLQQFVVDRDIVLECLLTESKLVLT